MSSQSAICLCLVQVSRYSPTLPPFLQLHLPSVEPSHWLLFTQALPTMLTSSSPAFLLARACINKLPPFLSSSPYPLCPPPTLQIPLCLAQLLL